MNREADGEESSGRKDDMDVARIEKTSNKVPNFHMWL